MQFPSLRKIAKSSLLLALVQGKAVIPKTWAGLLLKKTHQLTLDSLPSQASSNVLPAMFKDDAKGALCISLDWDLHPYMSTQLTLDSTRKFLHLANQENIPLTVALCGKHAMRVPEALELVAGNNALDVASHTFSHIDLSGPSTTREELIEDLGRNAGLLKVQPRSFVFPFNREGHIDVLRELGFTCYRSGGSGRLGYPKWEEGIWGVPSSYYLTGQRAYQTRKEVEQLLDLAIHYGCLLHLWSHPWNMSVDGDVEKFMVGFAEPFFRYAVEKRDEGRLWIATMREIADYGEAARNTRIHDYSRTNSEVRFIAECQIESPPYDYPPEVTLKTALPHRARRLSVYSNGILTHSFSASWDMYSKATFTTRFEKPKVEVRIQWS